jgi:hypothetical protein
MKQRKPWCQNHQKNHQVWQPKGEVSHQVWGKFGNQKEKLERERERERAWEGLKGRLTAIPIPKRYTLHPSGLTQHVDQPLHKEVHDQDEFAQCKTFCCACCMTKTNKWIYTQNGLLWEEKKKLN